MNNTRIPSCTDCGTRGCRDRKVEEYPPFCPTEKVEKELLEASLAVYENDEQLRRMAWTASFLEAEFYCRLCRVEETIEFIKRMQYRKIGLATCMGLLREARIFGRILQSEGLDYYTVTCKTGAVDKEAIGIRPEQKINGGCGHESMCNPVLQAKILAGNQTDFNIVLGLCVGHDSLFLKFSEAPATVMIVKDRVLGHNPVAALYAAGSSYSRFKTTQPADSSKTGL